MKLVGNPKDQVESANSKDEARKIIEKAGMELNADELEMVTGGSNGRVRPHTRSQRDPDIKPYNADNA